MLLLCFVKKLTVIGIIGNTQGVNKAAKPEKNAIMNIVNKLLFDDCFFLLEASFVSFIGVVVAVSLPEILKFKSINVGGKQLVSSQTINSTSPIIFKEFSVRFLIRCLKMAFLSKYLISISKTASKIV